MANLIPPIPNEELKEGHLWREWFYHLGDYIAQAQVGLNPWTVPQGGTGAGSLTGYVKGTGTSALTGQTGVPTSDLTGTLAATTMPALTGDVTSSAGSVSTSISAATVTGKALTGFVSGAGTVAATDTILQAVDKLDGNVALKAPIASPTFTGIPAAPTAGVGTNTTQLATTAFVLANIPAGSGNTTTTKLPTITGTVAASALTIGASSIYLDFRSATLGDGTVSTVLAAPTSLVVPSTATLGTVNAIQSRLIVLEMNNAGTAELAVVNLAGGNNLDETTLISTTAISATADLNNVIYSTTARTNLPFRVVGYIESTQATAGTWATAPSTIQGAGGNALTAMSSAGYGQTWQNLTASRAYATTYYNATGKEIEVSITITSTATHVPILTISGIQLMGSIMLGAGGQTFITAGIPAGASYSISASGGAGSLVANGWLEKR